MDVQGRVPARDVGLRLDECTGLDVLGVTGALVAIHPHPGVVYVGVRRPFGPRALSRDVSVESLGRVGVVNKG